MTGSVSLSICGDVERPACLALAELRSLMDAELVADFHCREGWSRPGERWRGVRLGDPARARWRCGRGRLCHGRLRRVHRRAYPRASGRMSGCSSRSSTKEPRAPGARLPAAGRTLRVGLLPERQVGGPDRGHTPALAGDRGGDCARPARTLSDHHACGSGPQADGPGEGRSDARGRHVQHVLHGLAAG